MQGRARMERSVSKTNDFKSKICVYLGSQWIHKIADGRISTELSWGPYRRKREQFSTALQFGTQNLFLCLKPWRFPQQRQPSRTFCSGSVPCQTKVSTSRMDLRRWIAIGFWSGHTLYLTWSRSSVSTQLIGILFKEEELSAVLEQTKKRYAEGQTLRHRTLKCTQSQEGEGVLTEFVEDAPSPADTMKKVSSMKPQPWRRERKVILSRSAQGCPRYGSASTPEGQEEVKMHSSVECTNRREHPHLCFFAFLFRAMKSVTCPLNWYVSGFYRWSVLALTKGNRSHVRQH